MARTAKPKRNFSLLDSDKQSKFSIQTRIPWRIRLAYMLTGLLSLITIMALFAGSDEYSPVVIVCLVLLGGVWIWAKRRKKVTMSIDEEGMTFRGKKYLYTDIVQLGYKNQEADTTSHMTASRAAASKFSYYLYIIYGTKQVNVATGFDEHEAAAIYRALLEVLQKWGFQVS